MSTISLEHALDVFYKGVFFVEPVVVQVVYDRSLGSQTWVEPLGDPWNASSPKTPGAWRAIIQRGKAGGEIHLSFTGRDPRRSDQARFKNTATAIRLAVKAIGSRRYLRPPLTLTMTRTNSSYLVSIDPLPWVTDGSIMAEIGFNLKSIQIFN